MFKLLVTDTLFIFPEHEKRLHEAGIEVERLKKQEASDAELIRTLKGKDGYILGGTEKVSTQIIESADNLKVISLTGTAWKYFIPGWQDATDKGIFITNAPNANAGAVAEWVLVTGLSMTRNLFALGRTGKATFATTNGFDELHVGVVGLGHIGRRVAELFSAVGTKRVTYWNRTQKDVPFEQQQLEDLMQTADIVCVCVSEAAGDRFLNASKLSLLKDGALVTCLDENVLDDSALLAELESGRIRAYLDRSPVGKAFAKLSLEVFYCSNENTAFNTRSANKLASDMVTESVINILGGRTDQYVVNR